MSVWGNLVFSATNTAYQVGSGGLNWRIVQDTSDLEYKNRRYKSVLVHIAKQLLMSELEGQIKQIVPKYKKHLYSKLRDTVLKQQEQNRVTLIKNQEKQSEKWGQITAEGGHIIVAKNKYGDVIKESLILYYDAEEPHKIEDIEYVNGQATKKEYNSKTVCHIDLLPQISMNSTKNIVMTPVQGRDYTRKELVSGGDLQFTINGSIVSEENGIYPADAVKKFIQMMQYNGILNVNHMMLDQMNVTRVIVKDYSLGQQSFKNIQPYTINCVAVEPDEDVKVQKDTIAIMNEELQLSPMSKWYKFILDSKWGDIAASAATNMVSGAATSAVGLGMDELVPNI